MHPKKTNAALHNKKPPAVTITAAGRQPNPTPGPGATATTTRTRRTKGRSSLVEEMLQAAGGERPPLAGPVCVRGIVARAEDVEEEEEEGELPPLM